MSTDMQQITIKLPEHVVESLEHVAAEQYNNNRSEAVRDLLTDALEADTHDQELQDRIEELERENKRLRNEKRTILNQREENAELVAFAEQAREAERYRDRRQRLLDQAGILSRWKWKITGVPVENSED